MSEKHWIYITNQHGLVRIFDKKAGRKEIAIRLSSKEDVEQAKILFERMGFENVLIGTSTSGLAKSNNSGFQYY